jgi:predicted ribosome quality control (RQC) complex YloA/Tae2 family protein
LIWSVIHTYTDILEYRFVSGKLITQLLSITNKSHSNMSKMVYINSLGNSIEYSIGKNAQHNFDIIDRADEHDIWFHINGDSSCHVIAHLPTDILLSKKQLKQIITQGAVICKSNSRHKSGKNIPIVYTHIKHVKKTDTIGTVTTENAKVISI